jgi:integrase/recombinase XerC
VSDNALIPIKHALPAPVAGPTRLIESFLAGRSPRTLDAYRRDLLNFTAFVGAPGMNEAARLLLSRENGPANELALRYRANLLEQDLSPATINRRLAALRSLVKLARTLGMVPWGLDVPSVRSEAYRDTRGPEKPALRRLYGYLRGFEGPKAARDMALIRLMYDLALRRGEVTALDFADVDLEGGTLAVLGKGRTEKEKLTLPVATKEALKTWIETRETDPGPLFTNFDRAGKGRRLTGRSIERIVKKLGEAVGVEVRPHGLRHAAITEALDATGGDVRAVQRFSRHSDLRTLMLYDDNRSDLAGEVAKIVSKKV